MSFNGRSGSVSENGRETDPYPENEQAGGTPGEEPLTPYQINALELEGQGGYASHNSNENEDWPEIEQPRWSVQDRRYIPKGVDPSPQQIGEKEMIQIAQEDLIQKIEKGLVPAYHINSYLEDVGLMPKCQVCKGSAPPLIQACSLECYNGQVHYECLADHLIDNFDPRCEYCDEEFHDRRITRSYRTPGPLFMRARFLRDSFFRRHTFDYGLGGIILVQFLAFVAFLGSLMYRLDETQTNFIVTSNLATLVWFALMLSLAWARYQDQFPHKILRFKELYGHPDANEIGRLTVNITELQRRHRRGLN